MTISRRQLLAAAGLAYVPIEPTTPPVKPSPAPAGQAEASTDDDFDGSETVFYFKRDGRVIECNLIECSEDEWRRRPESRDPKWSVVRDHDGG